MTPFASAQRAFQKSLRLYLKTFPADERSAALAVIAAFEKMRRVAAEAPVVTTAQDVVIPRTIADAATRRPAWQYKIIRSLGAFVEKALAPDIVSFVVHGSFATGDFIDGWSDLDTVAIVRDAIFADAERLMRFKKSFSKAALACYAIDPLAHHELVALSELDVAHYPQTTFPLPLYENGVLLYGESHIRFELRDDAAERHVTLREFRDVFARKVRDGYSIGACSWKQDLSRALMLPALALEATGELLYKRETFARVKERFPELDWSAVDEVSKIRDTWRIRSIAQKLPASVLFRMPGARRLQALLMRPARYSALSQTPADVERLTRAFLRLTDDIILRTS